tara:strand:+ start:232 stop:570 length:339 start_codon:yes stop_codon:yes gene_type:complete
MAAGNYDIVIDQGADFALSIALSEDGDAISLISHTVSAQLRPTPSSNTLTATFTCDITDAANGTFTMKLGHAVTANIAAGKYYYDTEIFNSSANTITRLIQGVARVTQNVTR